VKKGLNNVTVDGLVEEITPRARATVPDDVKKDLLKQIKDFIDKNA
jgi:enhancer of yellow 2 transcription factor